MGFLDDIQYADQSTVEETAQAYPFIQWVNGSPQNKKAADISYTGGWFMPEDQAPENVPEPWQKFERVLGNGEGLPGYAAQAVSVAVIRYRRQWVYEQNGEFVNVPWNQFQRGMDMRGHMQILVAVAGLPGSYVLTMKGMSSKAFADAFKRFTTNVLGPANAAVKGKADSDRRWPQYAFWLTLSAPLDEQGLPKFVKVGSGSATSQITPMQGDAPETAATQKHLESIYVGGEMLKSLAYAYQEAGEWATAWDSPATERERAGAETGAPEPDPEMNF